MNVILGNTVEGPIRIRPSLGKKLRIICTSGEASTTILSDIRWIEIVDEVYSSEQTITEEEK